MPEQSGRYEAKHKNGAVHVAAQGVLPQIDEHTERDDGPGDEGREACGIVVRDRDHAPGSPPPSSAEIVSIRNSGAPLFAAGDGMVPETRRAVIKALSTFSPLRGRPCL